MKRIGMTLLLIAVAAISTASAVLAEDTPQIKRPIGYYKVFPLRTANMPAIRGSVAASTTIPMFSYALTSPIDGHAYQGLIVGRSPFFHGARTIGIPTVIVPLIIKMPDGGVFDPTKADPTCSPAGTPLSLTQNSPIFKNHDFVMDGVDVGTGQYIDEFQRGTFWTDVSVTGNRYHNVLSPVTTATAVTFNVPVSEGKTYPPSSTLPSCGNEGVVDNQTLDNFLQGTAIPGLAAQGVKPTTFPIFVVYNVVQGAPGTDIFGACCILGFHNAIGFPTQTYGIADYETSGLFSGTSDTTTMAHEVGEWMDDPLGSNGVPNWGHIGQQTGCQNNLEVGDPLSGSNLPGVLMPNGFTYALQELAYFSWFYRQSPSLGTDGDFSNNETFEVDAGPVCF